ncbi:MAG: hypothetical protein JXA14_20115, partial [Anaerolineae bacterium]|nr:hypothetical protein [Anaerolineae bacterium]
NDRCVALALVHPGTDDCPMAIVSRAAGCGGGGAAEGRAARAGVVGCGGSGRTRRSVPAGQAVERGEGRPGRSARRDPDLPMPPDFENSRNNYRVSGWCR